jgi:hypothetical protein
MANKDKVSELVVKSAEYKLPTGVILHARKPNNGDRRTLLEAPDTNRQYLMEILASGCITKIEFPIDHEKYPAGKVFEYDVDDRKDVWARMDVLDLEDSITYVEAFGTKNWPSEAMIKQVIDAATKSNK